MSDKYDFIIVGDTLPSALFAYHFSNQGFRVQLLSSSKPFFPSDNEHFIIFDYDFYQNIFEHFRQKKLIAELKRKAAHLLITAQVEQSKPLGIYSRFIIGLNNLISSQKIKLEKLSDSKKMFRLTYPSYKISTNRLFSELIKSVDNQHFNFGRYDKILALEQNSEGDYLLETENNGRKEKILSKSVLSSDFAFGGFQQKSGQLEGKSRPVLYITYPADELKIEKNIIFDDGNVLLKVIPWFEWVYFEFSQINNIIPEFEQLNQILQKHFSGIKLDKEKIAFSGLSQRTIQEKGNNEASFIYFIKNQQYIINSRSWKKWLIESHNIIKQVAAQFGEIAINDLKTNDKQLTGGMFDFPYHPVHLMEYADEKYDLAKQILKSPQYFKKLFYRYGSQIEEITNRAFEYWNQTKNIQQAWLMAEIWYSVNYEFCTSAAEFVHCRTEEWMSGKSADIEFIQYAFDLVIKEG